MFEREDTIAAIATPIGVGGISVIRISGPNALVITDVLFKAKKRIRDMLTHSAAFGNFYDTCGNVLDEVIAVVYRTPNSYTGEDVVEISCHGGMYITRKILDALIESGARHAKPGEFTLRAFINGRIDLSQAEAVADLIHSRTDRAHKASLDQLKGRLSAEIHQTRQELLNSCSLLELELDFVEENLEFVSRQDFKKRIQSVIQRLDELINSYKVGKVYRDGINVVIVGKPNVGKSSLLNALLQENRAIVTDIPGTTRDIIEENLNIDGVLFKVIDTAGLRDTNDPVESEGVQRTLKQIERSDIALLIIDYSIDMMADDIHFYNDLLKDISSRQIRPIVVFNKNDIAKSKTFSQTGTLLHYPFVKLSAKTGSGLDILRKQMVEVALGGDSIVEGSVLVTNSRHRDALIRAKSSLELAKNSLNDGKSGEFVALDLRASLDALGEITGVITTEDILNNIFSQFCIGK